MYCAVWDPPNGTKKLPLGVNPKVCNTLVKGIFLIGLNVPKAKVFVKVFEICYFLTEFLGRFYLPGLFLVLFLHLKARKKELPWQKTPLLPINNLQPLTS